VPSSRLHTGYRLGFAHIHHTRRAGDIRPRLLRLDRSDKLGDSDKAMSDDSRYIHIFLAGNSQVRTGYSSGTISTYSLDDIAVKLG
jgi:hypothetical protein